MSSPRPGFLDSLISAVQENPLAASLIGGGAAWLLIGSDRLRNTAASVAATAAPIVDIAARNARTATMQRQHPVAPPTAPEMDHDEQPQMTASMTEKLREAGGAATESISEAAGTVKERIGDGMAYAREGLGSLAGKETLSRMQSSLSDTLERQPLVTGMIGLAIGAAIAGAFRTSDLENQWAGELSDDVKADLGRRAEAVSQSLREATDTVQAELGDTGAEAVDRLKQAGMDAAKAARDSVG
jgi:hypothetical protein